MYPTSRSCLRSFLCNPYIPFEISIFNILVNITVPLVMLWHTSERAICQPFCHDSHPVNEKLVTIKYIITQGLTIVLRQKRQLPPHV